jgi:hypothetical protein
LHVRDDAALASNACLVARLWAAEQQGSDIDCATLRRLPTEAISTAACGYSGPSPHRAGCGYRRSSCYTGNLGNDLRITEDASATSIHECNGSVQADADDAIY